MRWDRKFKIGFWGIEGIDCKRWKEVIFCSSGGDSGV